MSEREAFATLRGEANARKAPGARLRAAPEGGPDASREQREDGWLDSPPSSTTPPLSPHPSMLN